jgi:hypothetical protein
VTRDEHACDLDHIARQAAAVRAAEQALRVARRDLDHVISSTLGQPNPPPVTRVAEYAGLSRESVYQALRRQRPGGA